MSNLAAEKRAHEKRVKADKAHEEEVLAKVEADSKRYDEAVKAATSSATKPAEGGEKDGE